MQLKSNDLLIRELTNLDIKNNNFKPTIFNSSIKDFEKKKIGKIFSRIILKTKNNNILEFWSYKKK